MRHPPTERQLERRSRVDAPRAFGLMLGAAIAWALVLAVAASAQAPAAPIGRTAPVARSAPPAPRTPAATTAAPDAVAAARAAVERARRAEPVAPRALADAWRDLARALTAARRREEALDAQREQLRLRVALDAERGDFVARVTCRLELGGALALVDRHADAFAAYAAAAAELDRTPPAPLPAAQRALLRVGLLAGQAQAHVLAGEQPAARALLADALALARAELGERAHNTQVVRLSLATSHALSGEPDRARELAQQALTAYEASAGPEHLRTAHAAFALGQFERMCGRCDDAARNLDRAVAIRRARLGPTHADTLTAEIAHAQLLAATHRFAAARDVFERLHATLESSVGAEHEQTIAVGLALAEVLTELRRAARALPLAERGLAHRLAHRGPRAAPVVHARLTLARALHGVGRWHDAVAALEQARRDDDGTDPELVRAIRQRLAGFLPAVGREAEAIEHARANLREFPRFLATRLPVLRDADRLAFVRGRRQDLDHVLSWAVDGDAVAAAHRDAMQWKAQVARGLLAEREWLRRQLDADTVRALDALQQATAAAAAEAQQGDARAAERWRAHVERLTAALPDAGSVVPTNTPPTGRPGAPSTTLPIALPHALPNALPGALAGAADVAPAAVAAALAPGEVLVDYHVHERSERFGAVGEHLVAFVLAPGASSRRIDLGPLAPIAEAVHAHLRVVARRTRLADAASTAAAAAIADRARALVWAPVAAAVGAAARVYVCADGVTALLPFGSLPGDAPGAFLLEQHELVSLLSPAELLQPGTARAAARANATDVVLLGDVDYGGAPPRRFAPLPATAAELAAIAAAATAAGRSVLELRGTGATLAALRAAVPGARVVHLATHGVFGADAARAGGSAAADERSALPGGRAGVALAGANTCGVATADELAWLDLAACELVVLSACDTAIGDAPAGEHVLGLRRALRLAGARATVSSAWAIDDRATAPLMADFHRRLAAGAGAAAALRAAQLAALARARAAGDPLPGTWAAFVVEGR